MGGFCESLAVLPYLFDQGGLLKYVAVMEFDIRAEKLIFFLLQFHQEKMHRLLDSKEKLELERLQQDTERMKVELERSTLQLIQEGSFPPGLTDSGIYHDQCYI